MRGALALALVLATTAQAKCLTHDKWTGYDKNQHVVAGLMAGAGAMAQFRDPLAGLAVGAAIGALKEASDSRGGGTCSLQDFIATAVGAGIGAYGGAWLLTYSAGKTSLTYRTEF